MKTNVEPAAQCVGAEKAPEIDPLIPSAEQRRLAGGISSMTLWRWEKAGIISPPMKIRGRNYRRRAKFIAELEAAANSGGNH